MTSLYAWAWRAIFDAKPIQHSVSEFGYFDISADEIKQISGREPRLLTKVDFRDALPKLMKQDWLSILAIGNGLYRIAKTDPFIDIPWRGDSVKRISAPTRFATIDPFDVTSESMALDMAKISWMMDKVFGEKTELTIRWRLRKGSKFDFELDNVHYPVNGVQIEVDWWYEWKNTVNLVEAKLGSIRTLSIRQLLYPELAWKNLLGSTKEIHSFAFIYEESFFRFLPFTAKSGRFVFDIENELSFKFIDVREYDVLGIRLSDKPNLNFEAPFPQADNFDKIIIMLKKIYAAGWEVSKDELSRLMEENDIGNERQIGYYSNCLRLFKLTDKKAGDIRLTKWGYDVASSPVKTIAYEIGKALFSERVFHTALHLGMDKIEPSMFLQNWINMNGTTLHRRKRTLEKWVNWYRTVFDLGVNR